MKTENHTNTHQNLSLFREMTKAIDHLYNWTYDTQGNLLYSDCPHEHLLHTLFFRCGFFEKALLYSDSQDAPYALGTYMGLSWFAVFEKNNGVLCRVHLLGPVLYAPVQEDQLEVFFRSYEENGMKFSVKHQMIRVITQLPIIFQKQFGQLALMLDYCVNHRHLSYEDLQFLVDQQLDETTETAPALYRDTHKNFCGLMEHLRLGDLSYLEKRNSSDSVHFCLLPTNAAGIRIPLRAMKDSAVIFISQCANAAIDGGLGPEVSYAMADRYIGSIEKNRSALELTSLMSMAYRQYTKEVYHIQHQDHHFSPEIQSCIDYIDQHPEEKLSIKELAFLSGYSTYYLSRKFKSETGTALTEYIRQRKIKQGALLLATTDLDLEAIAERLGFCSRSHFSDTFHKQMGISPSDYRKGSLKQH